MKKDIVKLLRADYRTGKVLDENFILFNKSAPTSQIIYTYFDALESAIGYINANKGLHTNVEFHIYVNDTHVYKDVSNQDLTTELFLTPNFRRSSE